MEGPHPTFSPDIIQHPAIDVICRGEGEYAMLDIANTVDNSRELTSIPNLWAKVDKEIYKNEPRPLIEYLDTLPLPDREMYYKYPFFRQKKHKNFIAGRGCPFRCSFCSNNGFRSLYNGRGTYVRLRSPENLVEEIAKVKKDYGLKTVFFDDDTFATSKEWLIQFAELYRKSVGVPFCCGINVKLLDKDRVNLLKQAGCIRVSFGIESGRKSLRETVLNKNITDEEIIRSAYFLKKYGIKFMTFNMIGIPGENVEDAFSTIKLNIKIRADYPRCSVLTPYPGTGITDSVSADKIKEFSQHGMLLINTPYKKELKNVHYFFQTAVLFPSTFFFIKQLIKIPPNLLFKIWWAIIYSFVWNYGERRDFRETMVFTLRSFRRR